LGILSDFELATFNFFKKRCLSVHQLHDDPDNLFQESLQVPFREKVKTTPKTRKLEAARQKMAHDTTPDTCRIVRLELRSPHTKDL